jgi:dTMP kinase
MKEAPMKSTKGFFITLEGGEGSGKSTLLNHLAERLTQQGYQVVTTREPGGTQLGETIREWLLNKKSHASLSNEAELLLFLAARAQHIVEVIQPAIQAGKIVICDRFNDSTIAYQGAARGLNFKKTEQLCQLVCGEVIPQLTLFLDVDPEEGLKRTKSLSKSHAAAGQLDRIEEEKMEFHEKVRSAFLKIVKREPLRVYRIDANLSQSNVLAEAIQIIDELLLLPAKRGFKKL